MTVMDDPAKRVRFFTSLFLSVCALLLAAFYLILFRRDNAASVVDLIGFRIGNDEGFQYQLDRCWSNGRKAAASGWVVRKGHGTTRRIVRVVILDHDGNRAYAMKTSMQGRDDVAELLRRRLADGIEYRSAGFTASLNLKTANRHIGNGQLYIAYDDGDARVLLPIPCNVEWP